MIEPTPPSSGRSPDLEGQERGPLLTADDVAWIVPVPRSLIYALARRREPVIGIGERHVPFRAGALDRWIKSKETSEHNRSRRRRRAQAPEPGIRSVVPDAR